MDIKRIQYNQNLLNQKHKLTKEMKEINSNLKIQQELCNHIFVTTGFVGEILECGTAITECLYCSKLKSYSENDLSLSINATTYKSDQYGKGAFVEQRRARVFDLQNVCINYLEENPTLSEEELISRLKAEIESDKLKKLKKL